ncbi:MAG: NADH-quinone oxidoreductase subunit C [Actinomycetota bacterium]|nr:NADH-quinone oxidoreductase subunit C [Actinomycetota bacterium]
MTASETQWVQPDAWRALAEELHADGWWLADLCGLDALSLGFEHRFEAVVQLLHRDRRERRTVHVVATGEPPTAPSVVDLWPTARFMEREAFDLMGIWFDNHDNLTRIMMPEEWEGHPLRKDYGVGKVAIEFIPQPFLQIDAPGQSTMKGEAKAQLDHLGQVVEPEASSETPAG